MRTATSDGAWRIRGRSPRHAVEVHAHAGESSPHLLPVPDVSERRVHMRSAQHLAGRLRVRVSRGRRTMFEGESELAGLERGAPPAES
jgi:hypothetical protein